VTITVYGNLFPIPVVGHFPLVMTDSICHNKVFQSTRSQVWEMRTYSFSNHHKEEQDKRCSHRFWGSWALNKAHYYLELNIEIDYFKNFK
jgi:hypothetical protein